MLMKIFWSSWGEGDLSVSEALKQIFVLHKLTFWNTNSWIYSNFEISLFVWVYTKIEEVIYLDFVFFSLSNKSIVATAACAWNDNV